MAMILQKRPWNNDDCGLEKFPKRRPLVTKYPPPKLRTGLKVVRDFPLGFRVGESFVGKRTERNSSKKLNNVDFESGILTSDVKGKMVDPHSFKNGEFKTSKPKQLGGAEPSFLLKPSRRVEFWGPNSPKEEFLSSDVQKSKDTTTIVSQKELIQREKIKEAITMFNEVHNQLFLENRSKPKEEKIAHWRVPVEAAKIVKEKKKWMNTEKILGPVSGVQICDEFKYRSQLQMVGLHCQPQSGIDYIKFRGKILAISIVDSHRYSNELESSDVLSYSGQGGVRFLGSKQSPEDQKLERGNLALKNSMDEKTPVRVIRKLQRSGRSSEVFVYDGLYIVIHYTQEKGVHGKMVFMFQLKRIPGQPELRKRLNTK